MPFGDASATMVPSGLVATAPCGDRWPTSCSGHHRLGRLALDEIRDPVLAFQSFDQPSQYPSVNSRVPSGL